MFTCTWSYRNNVRYRRSKYVVYSWFLGMSDEKDGLGVRLLKDRKERRERHKSGKVMAER